MPSRPRGEAGLLRGVLERAQRNRCFLQEGPAGRGQRNLAAVADEQVGAEGALEVVYLVAERRLGEIQPGGGPAEVQLPGDSHEVAEEPWLQIHSQKLSLARSGGLDAEPGRRLAIS